MYLRPTTVVEAGVTSPSAPRRPLVSIDDLLEHMAGTPSSDDVLAKLDAASRRLEGHDSMTGQYWQRRKLTSTYWGAGGSVAGLSIPGGPVDVDASPTVTTSDGTPVAASFVGRGPRKQWVALLDASLSLAPGDFLRAVTQTPDREPPAPVQEACRRLAASLYTERMASAIDWRALELLVSPYRIDA